MSSPLRVRVVGPLQSYVVGFWDELKRLGYRPNAASSQLQLMAHLSRWLEYQCLGLSELTPQRLDEFLVDRRAEGCAMWLSPKALVPLLGFLRGLGVVPEAAPVVPETAADERESERMRRLERENRELRRANEILKAAAAFFGAELDRLPKR